MTISSEINEATLTFSFLCPRVYIRIYATVCLSPVPPLSLSVSRRRGINERARAPTSEKPMSWRRALHPIDSSLKIARRACLLSPPATVAHCKNNRLVLLLLLRVSQCARLVGILFPCYILLFRYFASGCWPEWCCLFNDYHFVEFWNDGCWNLITKLCKLFHG